MAYQSVNPFNSGAINSRPAPITCRRTPPYPNLMYSVTLHPRAWGSSDFDVRHSLKGSIIAVLPSPPTEGSRACSSATGRQTASFSRDRRCRPILSSSIRSTGRMSCQVSRYISTDPAFRAPRASMAPRFRFHQMGSTATLAAMSYMVSTRGRSTSPSIVSSGCPRA